MPDDLPRLLRSDAVENRERVLRAARVLFAEKGLAVTMRDIARQAGVGPATVYRRFPTKESVVMAAFDDELRLCRGIVEEGGANPDPWAGFAHVVLGVAELNARNHAFVEAFTTHFPAAVDFVAHRADLLRSLRALTRRAQDAGELRPDFVLDDLILVLIASRGLARTPASVRLNAARRFGALALDAFRSSRLNDALPSPARMLPE
jgi:AcrR family transcriptional regulator